MASRAAEDETDDWQSNIGRDLESQKMEKASNPYDAGLREEPMWMACLAFRILSKIKYVVSGLVISLLAVLSDSWGQIAQPRCLEMTDPNETKC